jgi:hypothetical protein
MRYLLINGAPGVGKSWLAREIKKCSQRYGRISYADPIRKVTGAFFGIDLSDPAVYDKFKTDMFYGLTGRQWMIHFGNTGRQADINHWVDTVVRNTIHSSLNSLYIIDDWGFDNEYLRINSTPGADVLTVYVGKDHASKEYEQFPGDSRFRCTQFCAIRAPDSSSALNAVKNALVRRGW